LPNIVFHENDVFVEDAKSDMPTGFVVSYTGNTKPHKALETLWGLVKPSVYGGGGNRTRVREMLALRRYVRS